MKFKRILAALLAALLLVGSGATLSATAASTVDTAITVHIASKLADTPNGGEGFAQPGYFFAWVTGVYPGNEVKWIVTDAAGNPLAASVVPGSANAAGYTVGLKIPQGKTYKITVQVTKGSGEDVNTNTPNTESFYVPDRTALRNALNNDDTLQFSFLYNPEKWAAYEKAKKNAIKAYEAYYLPQSNLDNFTQVYIAAQKDLPLADSQISEFLWHLLNFIFTVFNAIPLGSKDIYTL
jgi:hypothetical protein